MTAADSCGAREIDTAPGERVAPGQSQRHRAAPGQHDAQLPVRHGAQPRQIVVVDKLGGERQQRLLASVEQHRLAAAQRDDRRVEHPPPERGAQG